MPPEKKAIEMLVDKLVDQGLSQAQIAGEIGIAPQYLSDILRDRRPMTELIARRIGEKFLVDYRGLLGQPTHEPHARLKMDPSSFAPWLPIFPHPIEGEPLCHPRWEGTLVQVPGIAASKLTGAVHPYVLRYRNNDVEGRLHKNDCVLISQRPKESAPIVVIKTGKKCFLCRRKGKSWFRVADGREITGVCEVVGHCVGILWSALD